jgi:hypothetical protein
VKFTRGELAAQLLQGDQNQKVLVMYSEEGLHFTEFMHIEEREEGVLLDGYIMKQSALRKIDAKPDGSLISQFSQHNIQTMTDMGWELKIFSQDVGSGLRGWIVKFKKEDTEGADQGLDLNECIKNASIAASMIYESHHMAEN